MHKITIVGNVIDKKIELKTTKNGTTYTTFRVASNRGYGDSKDTTYFNVIVYKKPAENIEKYLKQYGLIYIEGILKNVQWKTKEGSNVYGVQLVAENTRILEFKETEKTQEKELEEKEIAEEFNYYNMFIENEEN